MIPSAASGIAVAAKAEHLLGFAPVIRRDHHTMIDQDHIERFSQFQKPSQPNPAAAGGKRLRDTPRRKGKKKQTAALRLSRSVTLGETLAGCGILARELKSQQTLRRTALLLRKEFLPSGRRFQTKVRGQRGGFKTGVDQKNTIVAADQLVG